MDAAGPNADQITYWNEQTGPKWATDFERLDRMIRPYGEAAMSALALRAGEHVLDIGCGCGDTTLALARVVGPTGSATGVDISTPMLARARERAAADGVASVRFVEADAQTHGFPSDGLDAIFSRFGVMFFIDPTAAFANLRTAVRPGGRLAFVCWQPITENPWMLVPFMAVAQIMTLPPPPPPGAPGPFAFGDKARVEQILAEAGFRDVNLASFAPEIVVGGGGAIDEAAAFTVQMGPAGAAVRQAGPEAMPKAVAAVREALTPYVTPRGVEMSSAAWVVTATR
jgi:SAM-dependent methyltransferase